MGILVNPSRYLTAKGGIALKKVGHAQWYLNLDPEQIQWVPSQQAVTDWLLGEGWSENSEEADSAEDMPQEWIPLAVKTLIALHAGNTDGAYDLAVDTRRAAASHTILQRIAELLILRTAARAGIDDDNREELESIVNNAKSWGRGALAVALRNRIEISLAYSSRHDDAEAGLERLSHACSRFHQGSDISGLGMTYNTMGVLATIAGQPERAEKLLRSSIPLLIVAGDLPTLQGALFNLAHARNAILSRRCGEKIEEVFDLIDLDCEMRSTLSIGRDSAQAEILAAIISLDIGDLKRAEMYLAKAHDLLKSITSEYDNACYFRTLARLTWCRANSNSSVSKKVTNEVIKYLRTAVRLFRTAGRTVIQVEKELKRVETGAAPFSCPKTPVA